VRFHAGTGKLILEWEKEIGVGKSLRDMDILRSNEHQQSLQPSDGPLRATASRVST
jgi:hypothetical protein